MKSNLSSGRRALVLLAAAASSLAACLDITGPQSLLEDPRLATITSPFGRTFLEVTPAGPVDLLVGDTITFSSPHFATSELEFTSSEPKIASVTSEGLLTALAPGEVRLGISRTATVRAASTVLVRIDSRGPATLQLQALTDSAGRAVQLDSVAGVVYPRFLVQRGDAARLEVVVGDIVGCSRSLPLQPAAETPDSQTALPIAGSAAELDSPEPMYCALDSAAFDSIGRPSFRNGATRLAVRLVRGDSVVLASEEYGEIRLRNPNSIHARVAGRFEATDSQGRTWIGGDLTATALPVRYEPGPEIISLTFTYAAPDGRVRTVTDSAAPYTAVFRAEELRGVLDESLRVQITSATSNGQSGSATATAPRRYDGVPPAVGSLAARPWIGADVEFASLYTPPAIPDPGVGRWTIRFVAGDAKLSDENLIRTGHTVARGGDLRESGPGAYRLAYQLCDAVLNCLWRTDFEFGVDLEPPSVVLNLPKVSINPAADLHAEAEDSLSGLGAFPLEVSVRARLAGSTTEVCGPSLEGTKLPGRLVGGICRPEPFEGAIATPRSTAGYFLYRFVAIDRAGNRSDPAGVHVLVDAEAPEIRSLVIPATLVAGEEATVVAEMTDNLDLDALEVRWVFPIAGGRPLGLPFASPYSLGSPFTGSLTPSATARPRIPVVRTLTYPRPGGRTTVAVDSLQARVTDAAGHVAFASRVVPARSFSGSPSSDPFSAVASIAATATVHDVCTSRCATNDPTTVGVTIRVLGEPGLSAFSRMYLMARDPAGIVTLFASTQNFSVTDTGTQRTYTYAFTYRPPTGASGRYTIFGVGVSPAGNALKTPDLEVAFIAR